MPDSPSDNRFWREEPRSPGCFYSSDNIGDISVGGSETFSALVYAGANFTSASSVSAGAQSGVNGYGAGDAAAPQDIVNAFIPAGHYSKIGSITIAGTVDGGAVGDQYGFVAANFGIITISVQKQAFLSAGTTGGGGEVVVHRLS